MFWFADGLCNAVWDGNLGMCFGILECSAGHMVGVKVHTAPFPLANLVDKVSGKDFGCVVWCNSLFCRLYCRLIELVLQFLHEH